MKTRNSCDLFIGQQDLLVRWEVLKIAAEQIYLRIGFLWVWKERWGTPDEIHLLTLGVSVAQAGLC
jgi:hypothetical protein